jgi:hypothetical protein
VKLQQHLLGMVGYADHGFEDVPDVETYGSSHSDDLESLSNAVGRERTVNTCLIGWSVYSVGRLLMIFTKGQQSERVV